MSRVGKKPIQIPENIEVKIEEVRKKKKKKKKKKVTTIKGPKGELSKEIRPEIKVELKENKIFVILQTETPKQNRFTTRTSQTN